MELEYPEIEERVFKKYKKTKADIVKKIIEAIAFTSIFLGLIASIYFVNESITTKANEKLRKQITTYEKILNYEYNRTFESFEEYIVYRANNILKGK